MKDRILFADKKRGLIDHYSKYFKAVQTDNIFDIGFIKSHNVNVLVITGNSFGIMDREIGISEYLNTSRFNVQDAVREEIKKTGKLELLIGDSVIVDLPDNEFDLTKLWYIPTMRLPGKAKMKNVTLAARELFRLLKANDTDIVLCTGLGTGIGKMYSGTSSKLVNGAYNDVLSDYFPSTWKQILKYYKLILA